MYIPNISHLSKYTHLYQYFNIQNCLKKESSNLAHHPVFQTNLPFFLLFTFASVALADSDHELGHEPLFRDNEFLRNGRLLPAGPIGLDLRTSVPARTSLPNLDQSIQFDTLTAPEVPEPFTTIAPPRQNKQRIPKQRRKKIPKQRIPKQRIPKQRIPKQRNDLANDATPGKEFCNSQAKDSQAKE